MASQISSLISVYSTIYSGADQRKHQSSASLAFVRGIHRWPVNSPYKYVWRPPKRDIYVRNGDVCLRIERIPVTGIGNCWRHYGYRQIKCAICGTRNVISAFVYRCSTNVTGLLSNRFCVWTNISTKLRRFIRIYWIYQYQIQVRNSTYDGGIGAF